VSKALLYHYYPGKDALIFAIIETHLSALDAAIAAADEPALSPERRLETLVRTVLDRYRGADDAHKVQLNAGPALSEAQKAALRAIERRIVGRFAEVIRALRPGLPPHLVMPATMSLFGMMNWVYMWFREGGAISRDDYARLATRIMLGGLPATGVT
jgi:AcrR family transcriptional regulator